MINSKFKKGMSLFLSILMVFTMLPATVFMSSAADYPVMEAFNAASSKEWHAYYNSIYSATFLKKIDWNDIYADDTVGYWDTSAADDESVMAYIKKNAEQTAIAGTARYDLYIAGDGGVGANADSGYIFYFFKALEVVEGAENFKTSNATSMHGMFYNCQKLREISRINWDTSNVTDMGYMFRACYELTALDLSSFNTAKVTDMEFMFYNCHKLNCIYAGDGWTTESIEELSKGVFNCCYALLGGKEEYEKYPNPPVSAHYAKFKEDGGYLTYKAPEAPTQYTVTYEFIGDIIPEGVTAPAAFKYNEGSNVAVEATPEAEGYVFSGWTTDDTTVENGEFTVNDNVHFTGSWTKLYNVRYEYTEGYLVPDGAPELPADEAFKAGTAVDIKGIPFVDGYVFIGWDTEDVTAIGNKFSMPEKDVTLYGYFKKPVGSVEINGGNITLDKDEEATINVVVKPEDATVKDVVYESSDESVVKVDENGKITPEGEGTATITVYSKDDPSKKDTITVTVKIPVENISVDKTEITLNKDDTDKITATVTPEEATNKEVTYESKDESVVKVDENGNITAVGEGTTTIIVASKDDPTIKEIVTVTVKIPVTEVDAGEDIILNIGDEKELDVSVNDDATNKEVFYEVDDPGVVKITDDGIVTAVGEGTTTITVISKDDPTKKDTVTVTVIIPVKDIDVDKPEIELEEGETEKITVTVTPDNATDKGVTYESEDETVATVDEEGNITAVGEGTTKVTVISKYDPTIKETITITVKKPVIEVEDIIVDKLEIELEEGETEKITVTVTPDNATDKGVTYESEDETVATVDEEGNITAVGEGTTKVTVISKYDPTIKETITITVKKPVIEVEDIVVDKPEIELKEGETEKITVTVTPDNATDKGVTYESEDETVATVDEEGNITAVGEGTTKVTVISKYDPTIKETITITVKKPVIEVEDIVVDKPEIELKEGETEKITVTVTPDDATDKGVTYESEDETVATVDEEGNITAVGEGTTKVTVISKYDPTIREIITITVKVPEPTPDPEPEPEPEPEPDPTPDFDDPILVPSLVEVQKNDTRKIEIIIDGDIHIVSYTSENPSIATVDAEGNITGIAPGKTNIRVEFSDGQVKFIPVNVVATSTKSHYIVFGKTEKIGWYNVSKDGGETWQIVFGNSNLVIPKGTQLIIRAVDIMGDPFTFYINGKAVTPDENGYVYVDVQEFMLIGALGIPVIAPDAEESLNWIQRIIKSIKEFFERIASWFKKG